MCLSGCFLVPPNIFVNRIFFGICHNSVLLVFSLIIPDTGAMLAIETLEINIQITVKSCIR